MCSFFIFTDLYKFLFKYHLFASVDSFKHLPFFSKTDNFLLGYFKHPLIQIRLHRHLGLLFNLLFNLKEVMDPLANYLISLILHKITVFLLTIVTAILIFLFIFPIRKWFFHFSNDFIINFNDNLLTRIVLINFTYLLHFHSLNYKAWLRNLYY